MSAVACPRCADCLGPCGIVGHQAHSVRTKCAALCCITVTEFIRHLCSTCTETGELRKQQERERARERDRERYIYIYIYMYRYIYYVHIYIYVYILNTYTSCTNTHIYIYIYIYTCMHNIRTAFLNLLSWPGLQPRAYERVSGWTACGRDLVTAPSSRAAGLFSASVTSRVWILISSSHHGILLSRPFGAPLRTLFWLARLRCAGTFSPSRCRRSCGQNSYFGRHFIAKIGAIGFA